MTIAELYNAVAQLGFEDSLGDEGTDRFIHAVNRAMLRVAAIRPATSSYVINHRPLNNLLGDEFKYYEKTADKLVITGANAKSLYFEYSGQGILTVKLKRKDSESYWSAGTVVLQKSEGFKSQRGLIKTNNGLFVTSDDEYSGEIYLEFEGDYRLALRNVALYDVLLSDQVSDIPAFSEYIPYDMASLVDDFKSFLSPPLLIDEQFVKLDKGFYIEAETKILLPYSWSGTYRIEYNVKPTLITVFSEDVLKSAEIIDLDDDLCALLPLLIASYIWLDDEPEKAQYYDAQYQIQAAEIINRERNRMPVEFKSVYGW